MEKLRFHDHEKLAHYAKEACDIEYEFCFGWGEINGTHNRTDYDLGILNGNLVLIERFTFKKLTYSPCAFSGRKYILFLLSSVNIFLILSSQLLDVIGQY